MASSLINNSIQVYFDSVFSMADEGMVHMFKALESSGLCGFLGCSSAIYEAALVDFFHSTSVRDNKVISAVQGKYIEISKELFAGIFELPTDGLTDMGKVPKDFVFDARRAFSADGKQLKTSCKKREIKIEFRLLNDILAKTVIVKEGYFDAGYPSADMVTPASKKARGFAVQICIILKGAPDSDLGESKAFPPLKILTAKTIGTYVAKNKNITIEEVVDDPVETVAKKAATKRRPDPAVVDPAAKKKRTTMGRAAPVEMNLAIVTVAQDVEPISVIPAVTPCAQRHRAPKRKLVLRDESDDEIVYNIIKQVLTETTEVEDVETDLEEPVVMRTSIIEPVERKSRIDVSSITNYDKDSSLKVLSNEEGPLDETENEKETEKDKGKSVAQRLTLQTQT
ncbi:hypothetical protein F511_02123 [Dorcoceras hygrometricum]|nr:hypothetical protein F511_02123 [Dorcoceras hygrometricum]